MSCEKELRDSRNEQWEQERFQIEQYYPLRESCRTLLEMFYKEAKGRRFGVGELETLAGVEKVLARSRKG